MKLPSFLSTVNKSWVGGVVSFIAVFVLQQFFHIQLPTGTTDLVTNILWQLLTSLGVAAPVAGLVYAVPNAPTIQSVQRDALKLGLAAIPAYYAPLPVGDTDEQLDAGGLAASVGYTPTPPAPPAAPLDVKQSL